MASLSDLRKKNRESLDKFRKNMEDDKSGGGSYKDERFWSPFFDKEKGRGSATVRFMPAPPGEDLPWVKVFSHSFRGPTGKWYMENSRTSLPGKDNNDPVGDLNRRLWNSGIESDKDVARNQKRRLNYYANVLVVDDPANPENNGQVFLYRFGPFIYGMLEEAMNPEDEDDTPINPFDPWEGADFVIKMKGKQLGDNIVPDYGKSYFKDSEAIGDDEEIEELWNKCYSLQEFVKPDNFKSYEELQTRLYEVLGPEVGSGIEVLEGAVAAVAEQAPKEEPKPKAKKAKKPEPEAEAEDEPEVDLSPSDEDDDDAEFFRKLAAGED